jgi:hypothetical protein
MKIQLVFKNSEIPYFRNALKSFNSNEIRISEIEEYQEDKSFIFLLVHEDFKSSIFVLGQYFEKEKRKIKKLQK